MKTIFLALGDLLAPRRCVVCGTPLALSEQFLCIECLADLPQTHFWESARNPMADRLNERLSVPDGVEEPYAHAAALFFYNSESGYRYIPYKIKYGHGIRTGRFFGTMLGRRLRNGSSYGDVDLVVPVPLHPLRRWSRGYNQAEVIAGAVARELGCPMDTALLRKRRYTRSQTRVAVGRKATNVAGAFAARRPSRPVRHILLIDDTFTTGSTLAACHAALRQALPPGVRISAATLAYVDH